MAWIGLAGLVWLVWSGWLDLCIDTMCWSLTELCIDMVWFGLGWIGMVWIGLPSLDWFGWSGWLVWFGLDGLDWYGWPGLGWLVTY